MPTPQDLERLRAILGQLTAISRVQRGELIRADDWNALVLAVADVARAVLAADPAAVVASHEHLDQVTSAWLSPQLRELLERGPLSDPLVQKRLTDIEQTLRRLRESLDASTSKVDEFRGRLTDVATRDLERQAAITNVRRALDGVVDPRPEIEGMRATLGVVQRDLSSVLEAASRLTVGGQVVDLGSVLNRVTEVEGFRDRFRTANGELLDAINIETRIAAVENRTVTVDVLDERLRNHVAVLDSAQMADLEGRVGGRLREQVGGVLDAFRGQVTGDLDSRLAGVGDLVTTRVNDALPGVTASVGSSLSGRIDAAQRAAVDAAGAAARRAIDESRAAVLADLSRQIGETRAQITGSLQVEVGRQVEAGLGTLKSQLSAATARLDGLAGLASRLDATQQQQAAALAALPLEVAALRTELRSSVIAEVDLRVSTATRSMEERLTAFQKTQDERFLTLSRDVQTSAVEAARKAAAETAQSEARSLRATLLAEMRGIAREEVSIAVRDQVRGQVDVAVREQFAAVPGLVAAEVRRLNVTPSRPGGLTPILVEPVR